MADCRDTASAIEHKPDCHWLHAQPSVDGDEGACCDCGAYEERVAHHAARYGYCDCRSDAEQLTRDDLYIWRGDASWWSCMSCDLRVRPLSPQELAQRA